MWSTGNDSEQIAVSTNSERSRTAAWHMFDALDVSASGQVPHVHKTGDIRRGNVLLIG